MRKRYSKTKGCTCVNQQQRKKEIMMMKLEPINDNVVVKLPAVEKELRTDSGIVLGTNNGGSKPDRGVVVAVGEGRLTAAGETIPLKVKAGDEVIFNRFAGTEIIQGDDKYLVLKEIDILVKVK